MEKIRKVVVYIDPNYNEGFEIDELFAMNEEEFFTYAKNCNEMHIYSSIEDFAEAFNNGRVSDEGYMRVINVKI